MKFGNRPSGGGARRGALMLSTAACSSATRLNSGRFVGYGAVSALIWVGTWTGIGYLLGDVVAELALRCGFS